jgi:Mg2+/citrate symporter
MAALLQMRPGQASGRIDSPLQLTSAESDLLYNGPMKPLQLVGLIASVALFVSCETTQPTGMGNQEQKRLAAIQQQQQEAAQMDEADRNLWNAHQDQLNTGTNPAIPYRQ